MAASRWYFSREQIRNSPSVRSGIEYAKELGYRQQCANFIQDIGQRLTVNQLCINTSIVYMHRFYMFHSFKDFHRNVMAPCFLFLGAKVEEQPRKLEHVLKVAYRHLHKDSDASLDTQSDQYMQMAQDLIDNESILLQTLGFELSVEHPHTYVVKCAQMVKAAKDLAQTSYFLATNSLHLTTFSIEKRPTVVACVCIYVACKWTSYEIPESHDKKHWWEYMDNEVTLAQIEDMTAHFIKILDSCPARLKKKMSAGPVIYKGGVLQLKRENDDESSTTEKHNKESSSKTSTKEKDSSSSAEKHSIKGEHSSDSSKLKERKEHSSMSLHSSHKHSKNPDSAKSIDSEKKHAEHQKHRSDHKNRHGEHNKHHGEQSKQDSVNKQSSKTRPDQKDSSIKIPEIKSSSSISRPVEKSSTKEKAAEEPSAAAKLILSLPPLQHKHSLPDQDQSSESPAKKKKLDTGAVPVKTPKLDLDSSKHHAKEQGLPVSSHHKHPKSSHSKPSSSKDKRKEKIPSDRHSSSHQHKQQSSHKSSHGQKHHSKSQRDMTASSSASDASVNESPIKKTVLDVGLKRDEQTIKTPSKHHQVLKTPQKSGTVRTPQKGQGNVKLTPKPSKPPDELLPPPPPPPSVDMMSMLSSPPPPAASPQAITPSKRQVVTTPQYGIQPDASFQQPNSVLPMTPIKTPLAGQSYQQQPQFIGTSQSATSSAANYGMNPMYYQGQEGQTFPPPSHNANLFSSQGMNLIPPPLPPPGMILTQVSGLPPPPPPLNMPFPPPP